MCIFPPLSNTVYMSGWSDVENEQRSGCGEYLMRIFILRLAKKQLLCVFVLY